MNACFQSLTQTRQFDYEMKINVLQIATISFEINHMTRFNYCNNRKNDVIIIFASNINVVAQNNLNYMRDNFINKRRDDRERDRDNRENIDIDLIFKMCYNCDSFEYLFNVCIKSHMLNFVLANWTSRTTFNSRNV